MFDIISVGDATIDAFVKIHEATVKCSLNKEACQICVHYADKIPVEEMHFLVAGNAANNAIGSSRLGLKASIYVNVGDDDSGHKIKKVLEKEKVDTSFVITHKNMESNFSTVLSFQGERTIFVYHRPWHYELPDLPPSQWIYLTSMSETFAKSNLYAELGRYLQTNRAKLAYNPGTFQLNQGVKHYPEILKDTEVFIVNKEEAKKVLNYEEKEDIPFKKLLSELAELGPRIVVITDGQKGSYGYEEGKNFFVDMFPGERVEATGAGDAYATGLMAALFHKKDLAEAMGWGAINGASVAGTIGPNEGLLTKEEMEEKRRRFNFKAKQI